METQDQNVNPDEIEDVNISEQEVESHDDDIVNDGEEAKEQVVEPRELTEKEQYYYEHKGWKPEWELPDGVEFRDVDTYAEIGEKIAARREERKYQSLERKVQQAEYRMLKKEYEDKLANLERMQEEAVEYGDAARVKELAPDLYKTVSEKDKIDQELQAIEAQSKITEEQYEFLDRNDSWFNQRPENLELCQAAHEYDMKLSSDPNYQHLDLATRLNMIERHVKQSFPERFGNKNKTRAPSVQPSRSEMVTGSSVSYHGLKLKDLPPEHQELCAKRCQADKNYTVRDYLKTVYKMMYGK